VSRYDFVLTRIRSDCVNLLLVPFIYLQSIRRVVFIEISVKPRDRHTVSGVTSSWFSMTPELTSSVQCIVAPSLRSWGQRRARTPNYVFISGSRERRVGRKRETDGWMDGRRVRMQ